MSNLMTRSLRLCFLLSLAISFTAGSALADGHGHEQNENEDAWDQSVVTKKADEVVLTLNGLLDASKSAPAQKTAFQQRKRDAAKATIGRAITASEDYAKKLRAGWNRGESEVYFRTVSERVTEMLETSGDAVPSKEVAPLLDRLRVLMAELGAVYGMP